MAKQLSFTKYENEILPDFRQRINKAESVEDVKKIFANTANELFVKIFADKIKFEYADVGLNHGQTPPFTINKRLHSIEEFSAIWNTSDLPNVIARLAESATNRYKHLEKHPEKTNSKIRM